jgi:uncharacterized membrane protein (DUF2068 family)
LIPRRRQNHASNATIPQNGSFTGNMSLHTISAILPWIARRSQKRKRSRRDRMILCFIGSWKIFYGVLLVIVGIGAFDLIGKNLSAEVWALVQRWNIDFHNHYIQLLFRKAALMDGKKLFYISMMTFGYSALFFIEGIGLIMDKHWAKWLVVLVTASFIPGETLRLIRQFDWLDSILLLINALFVIYLVWQIKTHDQPGKPRRSKPRVQTILLGMKKKIVKA